jgi:hypothetical protein
MANVVRGRKLFLIGDEDKLRMAELSDSRCHVARDLGNTRSGSAALASDGILCVEAQGVPSEI